MHSREDKVAEKWERLVAMGIQVSDNPGQGQEMWVRKVTELSGAQELAK